MKKKLIVGNEECLGMQFYEIATKKRRTLSLVEIDIELPDNFDKEYNINTSAHYPTNEGNDIVRTYEK